MNTKKHLTKREVITQIKDTALTAFVLLILYFILVTVAYKMCYISNDPVTFKQLWEFNSEAINNLILMIRNLFI